jgi:TonB family protein
MAIRGDRREPKHWLLMGSLAVAIHATAALALPVAPEEKPGVPGPAAELWFETLEHGASEGERADVVAHASSAASEHAPAARRVRTEPRSASDGSAALSSGESDGRASDGSATNDVGSGTAADLTGGLGEPLGLHDGEPAHPPRLIARGDPCRGYFPTKSRAHRGEVMVDVDVDDHGRPREVHVLVEQPTAEGFGDAAMACARRLQFTPAADGHGAPVAGHAKLRLRFRHI